MFSKILNQIDLVFFSVLFGIEQSRYRQVHGDVIERYIPSGEGIACHKRYAGINRRAAVVHGLFAEHAAIDHEKYVVRFSHVIRCHGQICGDVIVR